MDLPHRIFKVEEVRRLYRDLLNATASAIGSVLGGTPSTITPGDVADEGTSESGARSDHVHAIADFGSTADTFCEGNDPRLSDERNPVDHAASHYDGGGDEVDITQLGGFSGNANEALTGDGNWTDIGTAGGAFAEATYLPDLRPTSPHADNDEFNDGSVSGSWTTWDFATLQSEAEGANGLELTQTGNGTVRWSGKYKAVPNSEFAVIMKVALNAESSSTGGAVAIAVFQDATSSTGDFRTIELDIALNTTSTAIVSRTFAAYNNGTPSASTTSPAVPATAVYLRVRCNGTSMKTDYSSDGHNWKMHSSVTLGFTPAQVGPAVLGIDNAIPYTATFRFYRVFSGAGSAAFNASSIGRNVNLLFTE